MYYDPNQRLSFVMQRESSNGNTQLYFSSSFQTTIALDVFGHLLPSKNYKFRESGSRYVKRTKRRSAMNLVCIPLPDRHKGPKEVAVLAKVWECFKALCDIWLRHRPRNLPGCVRPSRAEGLSSAATVGNKVHALAGSVAQLHGLNCSGHAVKDVKQQCNLNCSSIGILHRIRKA